MSYTEAYKEAIAAAPLEQIIYETLEFQHPTFATPLRIVQGGDDIKARLEADAEFNAGEMVDFVATPFEFKLPDIKDNEQSQLQLNINNVAAYDDESGKYLPYVSAYMKQAALHGEPVTVIYRPYLMTELEIGPAMTPLPLMLSEASSDNYAVNTTATQDNIYDVKNPRQFYTQQRFPTLFYSP